MTIRWYAIGCTCAILLILLASPPTQAQTIHDEGLWWAFFGQGNLGDGSFTDKKLKWWFDGHARFLDDADGFNQSIVRPGIGYALTEKATVWAGYGWIHTSPLGAANFDEHRIWQQLTWSKEHNNLKFAFRSRLEQRFLELGNDTGWRFRQLLRAQHALPALPNVTLVGWDELFLNLNDTDWGADAGFDQNRVFVGFGWKHDPKSRWRVEVGYLNQSVNIPGGVDRANHILSINFYRSP